MSLFSGLDSGNLSFDDFSNDTFWDSNDSFGGFDDFINDFFGWDDDDEPEPCDGGLFGGDEPCGTPPSPNDPPITDEIIVTGTIVPQWQPNFFFDFGTYFDDALAGWFDFEINLDIPEPVINICGLAVTPDGGTVQLDDLNDAQADALADFLEALRSNPASADISGTIPGAYHTYGTSTTFTLSDIANVLSDITIVSGVVEDGATGDYHPTTNTLTIGSHVTDFSTIISTIIHEGLHAYIDNTPSIEHVVDHGQHGATSQEHQAWFEEIVNDLISQLEAIIGDLQDSANCS